MIASTTRRRAYYYALLLTRLSLTIACVWVFFGGHHPPVLAQDRKPAIVPVLTVEDAVQDLNITDLKQRLDQADSNNKSLAQSLQKTNDNMADLKNSIVGFQTEERLGAGVIGLLATSGLILQVRRKA